MVSPSSIPPSADKEAGFTLVELLCAIAVLIAVILVVSKLVNGTSEIHNKGRSSLDVEAEARKVFSVLEADISRMPLRTDLIGAFSTKQAEDEKNSKSDSFFFYTSGPGYFPAGATGTSSSLSLVGYRMNDSYKLLRYSQALTWDDSPFLSGGASALLQAQAPADPNITDYYFALSDQVFRLSTCFLLKAVTDPNNPGNVLPPELAREPWDTRINHTDLSGFRDVEAVVITIAILDKRVRQRITPTALQALIDLLPGFQKATGADIPAQMTEEKWKTTLTSLVRNPSTAAGWDPQALASVHVYQRYFFLNHPRKQP